MTLIFLEAEVSEILGIRAHSSILNHIYLLVSHFVRIMEFELAHMTPHISTS